jgi:hypothetical protein
MLRAEGIPSRVVSGFKGAERNRLTRGYEVQQRHAHAWVEANLDGRWVTLDPSPARDRNLSVASNAPMFPIWHDLRSAGSLFWQEYIVQMNLARQRRTLAPLRQATISLARAFREDWWPAIREQAHALATDPSRWISWQGGVVTFLGLLMAVGLWRLVRRIRRKLAKWRAARDAQRRRGRRVEFYERFRRLCRKRGWSPPVGQTQREFAENVSVALAEHALPPRLASLPRELTEDFYQVRFGDIDLPESSINDLDHRLSELEAALSNGHAKNGRGKVPLGST